MKLFLAFIIAAATAAVAIPISKEEIDAKSAKGLRLLRLAEGSEPVWKTKAEMMDLINHDIGFFDVTDYYDPNEEAYREDPSGPTRQSMVNPIIAIMSVGNLQTYLNQYTTFNNRYYQSTTGVQASDWLFDTINDIIALTSSNATVSRFKHTWAQSSIIAKFPGRQNGPITVIGAHLDSINSGNPSNGRAPGADDDGSGTVSILEAFRALAASGFQPLNTVEFQWFSAEEVGLRGSAAIVSSYKSSGVAVKGMMQMDMTAYVKPGTTEIIGFMQDYTSSSLNAFATSLTKAYNKIPGVSGGSCGYGCSDHASYNSNGYPSTMPFESTFGDKNNLIHSSGDTTSVSGFSWTHMLEYSKLAVAFAVELGNATV
ncbi:Leucine aminopeptidase 1 [Leucoagaricus sp. SymC.cos]|nr:Leucine aminopeptidase 1 [Leucoagaricus sp. SymC.cos]